MILPHKETCLVVCPQCRGCAIFQRKGKYKGFRQVYRRAYINTDGKITCRRCGLSEQWKQLTLPDQIYLKDTRINPPLFAFDAEHLKILTEFLSSEDRRTESFPADYIPGLNNLSKNFLLEQNRPDVLRALATMNDLLRQCGEGVA